MYPLGHSVSDTSSTGITSDVKEFVDLIAADTTGLDLLLAREATLPAPFASNRQILAE